MATVIYRQVREYIYDPGCRRGSLADLRAGRSLDDGRMLIRRRAATASIMRR